MNVLILGHDEVTALLPVGECVALMREALVSLAEGRAHQPLRTIVRPPNAAGFMGLMPAYSSGPRAAFGLKAICIFPGNPARGMDSHQGAVLLFGAETGELLAVVNASAVTAVRTAAVSAVATHALAREDAGDLCVIGAGVQARSHVEAMAHVRRIRRCRVASRRVEGARKLAEELKGIYSFPVEAVESVEDALRGADLIVTATSAAEAVVRREWVSEGAHINAVGSCTPNARELDAATLAASGLFVDSVESTVNEAGDYLRALQEGAITHGHIRAELGEVLTGAKPGRTSAGEITLFKSLGLAVEDLAAAEHLYRKARETGAGAWAPF
ncbi:MAG TPA: ornithine cyclodeaminase family protein [Pyrinomonadaceae bacterium]|jgi:ornithine cyclodeaminase|nr:ornithine cyclodeaminase family protein [Pyrinomonadaceae bacterium]